MRLCVIGYGASAASLIEEILERCEASAQTASASGLTSITVIEAKPSQLGLGLAYAQQPERLLLNQPADRMSLTTDRADFLRWARQHWDQHVDAGDCLPRYVFGNYMNWRRALTVPRAAKLGISLRTHVGAATEVTRKGRLWRVTCSTGVNTVAEYVVLATGHNPPQTFQSLEGADGYIADPLQFDSIVERAKGNRVGILGTSLTAIDVARVLLRDGSATSISMISRNRDVATGENTVPQNTAVRFDHCRAEGTAPTTAAAAACSRHPPPATSGPDEGRLPMAGRLSNVEVS